VGAVKDEISPARAAALADELTAAWPAFPRHRFLAGLASTLEPLALLARVDALADRLGATLPSAFADAARVLWCALDSPSFTGWMTLPCTTFVARFGIDHPEESLPLLAGLTPRWSSEFALRPFVDRCPELTYEHLRRWVDDDDEHVRRLVSEGSRPRLPWAPRLRRLIADPGPNLPLLDRLADDPSPYVRRSVANHLNDIAKDHPDLAVDLARRWQDRGDGAAWVARHGLRTLVKRGHPDALAALGIRTDADIALRSVTVDTDRIAIGEVVEVTCTLELLAAHPVDAVIDYRVHYVGARTTKAPKVFKLTRRRLQPRRRETVTFRHRFDHVSIRRIHPGRHTIDIQVNGRVLGSVAVHVEARDAHVIG
jgi:3-methyladenine DNA glycosylase AlkC